MTRPRYSMPELNRPWDTLRTELKLQVLREDVAAIREAIDAILANLAMDAPERNVGRHPRTTSRPSLWQLGDTVDEMRHGMTDVLRRLAALERP